MTDVLHDPGQASFESARLPMGLLCSGRRGDQPDAGPLDGVLQPFGRSRMLPGAAYTSPDVLRWEQRHLFAGMWTCVGREDDLRTGTEESGAAQTQRSLLVGDVRVLLTWSGDDVRAFANTCRHRAHELLGNGLSTSKRSIICPYHAWTYDLAGTLRTAPGYREVEGFEEAEYSLVALPVERWQGWLFVHAATSVEDGGAVDFSTYLGDLDRLIAPYTPGSLALGARHSYEVAANWKVISENYHECYHCPLIHPELCQVTPPSSGDNYVMPGAWVGGSMELRDGMQTMSITGKSGGVDIDGVDPTAVEYLGLFPNLLISAHPDYVMAHRMVPLAPDRTWVECSWYFPATADGDPIDPSYAVEFWDLTNKQDWNACESVQRGLASPHFKPGVFSPSEDAVHQFVTMVARAYLGQPIHELASLDAP
jgi:Rieske 2Fe-2S family protein